MIPTVTVHSCAGNEGLVGISMIYYYTLSTNGIGPVSWLCRLPLEPSYYMPTCLRSRLLNYPSEVLRYLRYFDPARFAFSIFLAGTPRTDWLKKNRPFKISLSLSLSLSLWLKLPSLIGLSNPIVQSALSPRLSLRSAMADISISIPSTYGAILLGTSVAFALSGIVGLQCVIYFKVYPDDLYTFKALVRTFFRVCQLPPREGRVRLQRYSAFTERYPGWVFTTGLSLSAGTDVIITGWLYYFLREMRGRMGSTIMIQVIDTLTLYTLETGALTCGSGLFDMLADNAHEPDLPRTPFRDREALCELVACIAEHEKGAPAYADPPPTPVGAQCASHPVDDVGLSSGTLDFFG
ncbi:hypothetical protein D9615_000872 [Tricholomella constricta]|uniref:DUF6534 domain-containing protein n=1 Tax=Tricholomella constricta TaxID=117010 RepID=A0A8H5HK55_9AGAR|nr:hypothetical protein D9615_000872 [Tricholomella constricta]